MEIADRTGIDVFHGDQALSIGEPPRRAVRLDGADGHGFRAGLTKLGARPNDALGRHFLAIGSEGSIDVKGPLAQLGVLGELDRAVVDGDTVAWGAFEAPVDEILEGSGQTLADDQSYAAAADCLGDVVAAAMLPSSSARIDGPAVLVAIGVAPPGTVPNPPYHEVLCVVTLDRTTADTYAAGMRKGLAPDAIEPRTNAPMRELVGPPGLLLQALSSGALGAFLGQTSPIP